MLRHRYCLPPILLVALSIGLGLLLVEMTTAVAAPLIPRSTRIALRVMGAIVSGAVTAAGVHRLVVQPLRRILHVVYRMTDGDYAVRTGRHGTGMTAEIMHALDDLAGRLEARYEAYRASETRYRRLYEDSPAGLFRTRLDGRLLECNKAAVRMLGFSSVTEAKTHNVRRFYAHAEDWARALRQLASEGMLGNQLIDLRRQDGRVLPVLATIVRSEGPGGPYLDGQFIDASGLGLEAGAVRAEAG